MLRLGWEKKREPFSILRIYTFSCLLFFILSFFNIYEFKVYDSWGLVVFYIYEGILWIGIKVGRARFYIGDIPRLNSKGSTDCFSFIINKQGKIIISLIFIAALLSFVYFLVLYSGSFNFGSFGQSIKAEFDVVARTKLEVVTGFIMQAGSAVYLIVIGSKSHVSKFTLIMARVCLFLPGLRGALLGRRFTLAAEALIFFFAEYGSISKKNRSMNFENKKIIRRIIIVFIAVVLVMLYIFSRRIVFFADELFIANAGDMVFKPFWGWGYSLLGDQMNVLAYVSFYVGHAPYAFAYTYAYDYVDFPRYWGLQTCRVFIQIITNLFGLSPSYAEMVRSLSELPRYVGYAGTVINDFGMYIAPFISFLFGVGFARIERERNTNCICHSLYPIIQVACFFAPIYFFLSVGAIDHVAFWAAILSPLCLVRCNKSRRNDIAV